MPAGDPRPSEVWMVIGTSTYVTIASVETLVNVFNNTFVVVALETGTFTFEKDNFLSQFEYVPQRFEARTHWQHLLDDDAED